MNRRLSPEQQSGGQDWSIYDGTYDAVNNPIDPQVIEFILLESREPNYSKDTRHRVVMGRTAIYAMVLCNFGLAANEVAQWSIGSTLTKLTGQPFSEMDADLRAESSKLNVPDPPVFAALSDMEAKGFINSYEHRFMEDVFLKRMIEEKKAYDMRIVEEAFGAILSVGENEAESEE